MDRERPSSSESEAVVDTSHLRNSMTSANECSNESKMDSVSFPPGVVGFCMLAQLLDVATFIASNGSSQLGDNSKDWQKSMGSLADRFDSIRALVNDREQFFYQLIQTYANLYNIQLHLIVYHENKYIFIDKNNFEHHDIHNDYGKHAVILCNADNTVYFPLYIEDAYKKKRTLFTVDELNNNSQINNLIDQANRSVNADDSNQMDRNANSSLDQVSHMAGDENSSYSDPPETLVTGSAAIEKLLQNASQLAAALQPGLQNVRVSWNGLSIDLANLHKKSPEELCGALNDQLLLISEIAQVIRESAASESHETATNQATNALIGELGASSNPSSENHVQTTTAMIPVRSISTSVPAIINEPIADPIHYEAPVILREPKEDWHVRYLSDLVPKQREGNATIATIASASSGETKEKAIIGLLQGTGGERSPIQVQVPIAQQDEMYLACGTRTIQRKDHALKILVPAKTTVNKADCTHENNLNCLNFAECSPLHEFDRATNSVYMKITSEEHTAQLKDVPLYMLNLYQNQQLTKEMIQDGNLRQCVLAFWLCVKVGGGYVAISRESHSGIITEVKKKPSGRKATLGEKNKFT